MNARRQSVVSVINESSLQALSHEEDALEVGFEMGGLDELQLRAETNAVRLSIKRKQQRERHHQHAW